MLCHDSGSAACAPICNIRAQEADAQAKLSTKVDAVTGKAIFQAHCALCHVVRMREKDDGDMGKPEKKHISMLAHSPRQGPAGFRPAVAPSSQAGAPGQRIRLRLRAPARAARAPSASARRWIAVRAVLHRLPVRKWQAQTKTCRLHLAIPSKNARAEVSSALIPLKACGRPESEQLPRNSLRDESRHLIHCPLEIDSTLSTHGIPQRSGRLAAAPHGR
jgi:hypothetical protein